MDVLITGGNGYIARGLYRKLTGVNITLLTRKDVDLLDSNQVDNYLEGKKFNVLIHTAVVGGSRLNQDDAQVCYDNLRMFFNIKKHYTKFKKIINFSSGAELDRRQNINFSTQSCYRFPTDPYGLSKKIINELSTGNTTNLRIYNVFDATEPETRFLKSNILRYIKKEHLIVHSNRLMSFFSLNDLAKVVQYIVTNIHKSNIDNIDCVYENSRKYLHDIAYEINKLDKHRVGIMVEGEGLDYAGSSTILSYYCKHNNIVLDGFDASLKNMFEILKNEL